MATELKNEAQSIIEEQAQQEEVSLPTTAKKRRVESEDAASTTIHLSMEMVPLKVIWANREHYENYPEFQREFVWKTLYQQLLIDSTARRFPVLPLLVYRDPEQEGHTDWIIDGKQRLTTWMRFLDNEFKTITKYQRDMVRPNSKLPLIEPGKTFAGLSVPRQRTISNYQVPFLVMEGLSEEWLPEIFARLQIHTPLSVGETLWINNTKMIQAVQELYEHPFWHKVYDGKDVRMMRLIEAISLIGMEVKARENLSPLVQLRRPELMQLASGKVDEKITLALMQFIWGRLERLTQVFMGAGASKRTDIIPIYQAGVLLEQQGYDLAASEEGCLREWFQRSKRGSWTANYEQTRKERHGSEFSVHAALPHLAMQRRFWDEQLPVLMHSINGLVKNEAPRVDLAGVL